MSKTKELGLEIQEDVQAGIFIEQANANSQTLDDHDHSAGKGKQIKFSSLEIDSNIDFNGEKITNTKGPVLTEENAPSNRQIYSKSDGNFYYQNASGVEVQITDGSNVHGSGGGSGGNSNLGPNYVSPAILNYNRDNLPADNNNIIYEFFRDLSNLAYAGIKSLFLVLKSSGGNDVKVKANDSSSAYTVTLPASAPSSTRPTFMDSSGNISTGLIENDHVGTISASKITGTISGGNLPSTSLTRAPFSQESNGVSAGEGFYSIDKNKGKLLSESVPSSVGPKIVTLNLIRTEHESDGKSVIRDDDDQVGRYDIFGSPFYIAGGRFNRTLHAVKVFPWYLWHSSSSNPDEFSDLRVLAAGTLHRDIVTDDQGGFDDARSGLTLSGNVSAMVFDSSSSGHYGFSVLVPNYNNESSGQENRSGSLQILNGWQVGLQSFYNSSSDYRG